MGKDIATDVYICCGGVCVRGVDTFGNGVSLRFNNSWGLGLGEITDFKPAVVEDDMVDVYISAVRSNLGTEVGVYGTQKANDTIKARVGETISFGPKNLQIVSMRN